MSTVEQKLSVLEKIKEMKHILFGPFSDKVTKVLKSRTWREIFIEFQSYPMCQNRNFSYLRDTFWPNARKTTLMKAENAKKLGVDPKYSPVDLKVLEIIGAAELLAQGSKFSANIATLRRWESLSLRSPQSLLESTPVESTTTSTNGIPLRKKKKRTLDSTEVLPSCHKKKLALQVRHLELLNYKVQLDCYERENRLGLPHHPKFTADLVVHPDLLGPSETLTQEDLCLEEDQEEEEEEEFKGKTMTDSEKVMAS
uniref:Regulatory protein zeste n=1 Tax=Cacopsylla melanoneura TaxID=428564 RepID=A0A8D9A7B9_9HEMI